MSPLFSSPKLGQALNNSTLLRFILLFACAWIVVLLINYFYGTIAMFTAAGLFAALLNYPVVWLCRYLPRGWAITFTFLGAITIVLALLTFVGLQVLTQGQGLIGQLRETLSQQDTLPIPDFLEQLEISKVISTLQAGLISGLSIVQNIFSSVFTAIFGAVISLYMLIDGEKLWQGCLKLIPTPSRDRFATIFQQSFLGFLRGQLLLMVFLSTATLVLFSILGVKYALVLAVIVGLLDAIPGIGAVLGVLVVTVLVFASQGGVLTLKVLAVSILLEQIQENYVRPKVMGDALELNPVVLFLSLFIGQRVAGLLGIFLAIPIAGMIAAWMQAIRDDRQVDAANLTPEPQDGIEPSKSP
ncbi:MAG: AI-2E family transporter [Elainella sp. Prado103]|jgi:predicted PurR-regulated permease PerM|nr:AI-2E family transporter [Elainella sp. Prado103]